MPDDFDLPNFETGQSMKNKPTPKQILVSVPKERIYTAVFYFLSASFSVLYLFREFFLSGKIPGDTGDTRLTFTLLNHWYRFFTLQDGLSEQIFFWPDSNTLGSTEALLGPGVLNTLLRFLQVSFLNSGIWTWIIYAFILFLGVFNFAKTNFKSNFTSFSFTVLIAFSYGLNTKMVHVHLIGFLITFFLISCYQNILRCNLNFLYLFGAIAGPFLFALSCWYGFMGSLLVLAFVGLSYALIFGLRTLRNRIWSMFNQFANEIKHHRFYLMVSVCSAFVFAAMWMLIYIPFVLKTSSSWAYPEVVYYSPRLGDLVNSSSGAFGGWNNLFNFLNLNTSPTGERALGLTPLLALSFLYLLYLTLFRVQTSKLNDLERVLIIGTLIFTVFMLTDDGGHSLWYLVYNYVPGASSLRAVFRLNLFLAWIITFVLFAYCLRLWRTAKFAPTKKIVLVFLVLGLFLESVRVSPAFWSLDQFLPNEYSSIAQKLKMGGCEAFYLYDNTAQRGTVQTHGDAVAIATYLGIPTINGASSQSIPGWIALNQPNRETLEADLENWLNTYNKRLSDNVCVIDY